MKKVFLSICAMIFAFQITSAQAVTDRAVIPVAVNLNQVLRLTVNNGGNIEFTFNTIDQYKNGISGDQGTSTSAGTATSDPAYTTNFSVASSSRWALTYGAEEATFIGTDNPANLLALNNVGFSLSSDGAHQFETGGAQGTTGTEELWSTPTAAGTTISALEAYPVVLIDDNNSATQANAGDITDNAFTMKWRCGTSEGTTVPMNAQALIEQSPSPAADRYLVNVIFDLSVK